MNEVDTLILTGGPAFAFVCAQGILIGSLLIKDTMVEMAKEIIQTAKTKSETIVLPVDAGCFRFKFCNSVSGSILNKRTAMQVHNSSYEQVAASKKQCAFCDSAQQQILTVSALLQQQAGLESNTPGCQWGVWWLSYLQTHY